MINLIFTRKSLLAGVKAESADLLNFDENSQIEFGNRSMREVLEDSFPQIIEKYAAHAKANNLVLNGSIPATLVFPVETTAREVHEIMHFVGSYNEVRFNIVHIDDLIQPFLHGQSFSKDDMKEPMIVLEGLDDFLSVIYYFNTQEVKHQSFITFEEKQAEHHGQHIIEALVKEFEKIGFSLNEDDQKELRYQHTLNNNTFFIQKTNGVATLSASVRKEDLVIDKSSTIDKYTLSRVLNKERLKKLGIKKIILIGEHLIEYGYPKYLREDLGLENMVYVPSSKAAEEAFLTIIKGVENRTSSPFQPDIKVAEVLNPPSPEKEFLDLSKLNAQLKPVDLAEKLGIKPQEEQDEEEQTSVQDDSSEQVETGLVKVERDLMAPIKEDKEEEEVAEEEVEQEEEDTAVEDKIQTPEEKTEDNQLSEEKSEEVSQEETGAQEDIISQESAEEEIEEEPLEEENTEEEVASIEILKRSLARLANKPLRDGTKEVGLGASEEVATKEEVQEEETGVEEIPTVTQINPVLAQEQEAVVEELPKVEEVVEKLPNQEEIAESNPVEEETVTENKLVQEEEVEQKTEKIEAVEQQVVKEESAEAQKEETEENAVNTLARSPQTGIEEWNRITEMEETLKRHEEEERKKFEMLKEKLALQRQQKAQKLAEKPEVPNVPRKNARSINLKEAFEFIKNFPEEEFITQMVLDKNLRAKKVLRFVSNADFAQSYIEYKFLRLYDKESRYYPGISGLYESEEGKFYMRNYYKGSTLAEYASKAGLAKKHSLKKLSSSDLEFIVKVIDEVNDSPVSHSNLHANNIIVQEKGFWRFNTVEQIRLVGFTSDDCSKEDMINRVHEIFHALLAPGVYSEFRNTLKL